jgi:hypothetical protein
MKKRYRCEVKLMGKGNPESADVIYARDTKIFIADKLSELNKKQFTNANIEWVELRQKNGYKKFFKILQNLDVQCSDFSGNVDIRLEEIFSEIFH